MARPLARDGNESNRIGSSMLKRCARNIARPGRDLLCPSTTWNEKDDARNCDIQNWSLRNTYTYNIIYIYTSFHITQTPKKKETSYHTLYFVGSWSEKFYQKKTWPASDLPERKKKHPSHGTLPPGVVFCPQGDFLASPEFSACGLGGFRCSGRTICEATRSMDAPDDRWKKWRFRKTCHNPYDLWMAMNNGVLYPI